MHSSNVYCIETNSDRLAFKDVHGYGTLNVREEDLRESPGETMPVADLQDQAWAAQYRFSHVSGNFWVVYIWTTAANDIVASTGAEIIIGVGGLPAGLDIFWSEPTENGKECPPTRYCRVQ